MIVSILVIFVSGLCAGMASGILGVGGGIILVPVMVFILGLTQHMAQGISLLVIIPTALSGAYHLHKEKLIHYRTAFYLAVGAVIGTILSSNFVQMVPGKLLQETFGIFIIFTGLKMIFTKSKKGL
ncbi:MAG: Sulfite exporter TauE/SafE [Firmicutes bacterium]|nr:Sulfite exporter TauE/SafE [Bacillota bacterium]